MPQQFGNFIYSFDQIVYIACRKTCLLFMMWDFQTNFDDWYFNISWATGKCWRLFLFKTGQYWQLMAWSAGTKCYPKWATSWHRPIIQFAMACSILFYIPRILGGWEYVILQLELSHRHSDWTINHQRQNRLGRIFGSAVTWPSKLTVKRLGTDK